MLVSQLTYPSFLLPLHGSTQENLKEASKAIIGYARGKLPKSTPLAGLTMPKETGGAGLRDAECHALAMSSTTLIRMISTNQEIVQTQLNRALNTQQGMGWAVLAHKDFPLAPEITQLPLGHTLRELRTHSINRTQAETNALSFEEILAEPLFYNRSITSDALNPNQPYLTNKYFAKAGITHVRDILLENGRTERELSEALGMKMLRKNRNTEYRVYENYELSPLLKSMRAALPQQWRHTLKAGRCAPRIGEWICMPAFAHQVGQIEDIVWLPNGGQCHEVRVRVYQTSAKGEIWTFGDDEVNYWTWNACERVTVIPDPRSKRWINLGRTRFVQLNPLKLQCQWTNEINKEMHPRALLATKSKHVYLTALMAKSKNAQHIENLKRRWRERLNNPQLDVADFKPTWRNIHGRPISFKQKEYLWRIFHDNLITASKLHRWDNTHSATCTVCNQQEETVTHMLIECPLAADLWKWWFKTYASVTGVRLTPTRVNQLFGFIKKRPSTMSTQAKLLWEVSQPIIIESILRSRWDQYFDGIQPNSQGITAAFKSRLQERLFVMVRTSHNVDDVCFGGRLFQIADNRQYPRVASEIRYDDRYVTG